MKDTDFKKETNSINVLYNLFPYIYFHSYVCSKIMKLIHKTNFFCAVMFPGVGLSYNQNHLLYV
jgi:hypothetical protein